MRHRPGEHLARHPHDQRFAAIVLSGHYVEAGDTGRHALAPGDVLVHSVFESHIDRVHQSGAEVLVVPLPERWKLGTVGRIADPDTVVRLAECCAAAAARELEAKFRSRVEVANNWPALLAETLLVSPDVSLRGLALRNGLHHGSLGRGFRQEFGITPARFRLLVRMHKALRLLDEQQVTPADAAICAGFADQSHLTRTFRQELGATPLMISRRSNTVRLRARPHNME